MAGPVVRGRFSRMKGTGALQLIFAFFLGLVVVGFIGLGVNTFYPEPSYTDNYNDAPFAQWRLVTGIILLVLATVVLAISLALPETQVVISNGILLGGVFTMVYAVGITASGPQSIWRFVVVGIALAVTIAIGYVKFVRRKPAAAATGEASVAITGELAERLAAIEHKLEAMGRALRE